MHPKLAMVGLGTRRFTATKALSRMCCLTVGHKAKIFGKNHPA